MLREKASRLMRDNHPAPKKAGFAFIGGLKPPSKINRRQ